MTISECWRELRATLELTQGEMAGVLGASSRSKYWRIENGYFDGVDTDSDAAAVIKEAVHALDGDYLLLQIGSNDYRWVTPAELIGLPG